MEPAGLAVGILALAGLFNNAVDCFEYVQIGKAFEQDLDTCLLRLAAERLKLSRWGQAIGLTRVTNEQTTSYVSCTLEEVEFAQTLVEQIIQLFETAAATSDKILKRAKVSQLPMVESSAITSSSLNQVTSLMRDISLRRVSKLGLRSKTQWALYQKGQFSGLVDSISDLVGELLELFPTSKKERTNLCSEEAIELCGEEATSLQSEQLQQSVTELDPELAAALKTALERQGRPQEGSHHNTFNFSGTFHGQSRAIGIQNGDAHITNNGSNSILQSFSQSTLLDAGTFPASNINSNVIGHARDVFISSDPLPSSAGNVPRANNSFFIGRQDVARMLKTAFTTSNWPVNKKPRTFVIHGLGGMGKSEVSIKYASDNKERYWGVFWVNCFDPTTAKASFEAIGAICRVQKPTVESVKAWLCTTEKPWLLVLDNADDSSQDYNEYLPSSGKGNIIITTRIPKCKRYQSVGSRELNELDKQDVRDLLFNTAGIEPKGRPLLTKVADQILEELGSHTLAVIHAGSYICESCPMNDYLKVFQKQQHKKVLQYRSGQEESTYKTVFATFEASAEKLESLSQSTKVESISPTQANDALALLHTIAFMHNTGDFGLIFARARIYADAISSGVVVPIANSIANMTQHHASLLPEFCPGSEEDLEQLIRWREAYRTLEAFSFVTASIKGQFSNFSMHRLVHIWARVRQQDTETQAIHWQAAASAVYLSRWSHLSYDPFFLILQEHAQKCAAVVTREFIESLPTMAKAQLIFHMACVNHWHYQIAGTKKLWILLNEIMGDVVLASKENEIYVRQLKGSINERFEDTRSAKLEFETCLNLAKEVGWTDEQTSTIQHELAQIYLHDGQAVGAIEILELVCQNKKKLAEDHPSRLESQRVLAIAYRKNGQVDKAITILEPIIEIEKKLAEDHPDRLASQHTLAQAYIADNQIDEAIAVLENVIGIGKKLPKDHPNRLNSQCTLAQAYQAKGQVDEAINILEYVVDIRKNLAQDHIDRLASQHTLARAYIADDQTDRAIQVLEHVVKIQSTRFPNTSKTHLASQIDLGFAYYTSGQHEEARNVLENVVKIQAEIFGESHQQRTTAEFYLASVYLELGQNDAVIDLAQKLIQVDESSDASNASYTAILYCSLLKAYLNCDEPNRAILLLRDVLAKQIIDAKARHVQAFSLTILLARMLHEVGNVEEAISNYETAMDGLQEKSSFDQSRVLAAKFGLAMVYEDSRQFESAEKLLEDIIKVGKEPLGCDGSFLSIVQEALSRVRIERGRPGMASSRRTKPEHDAD